MVMQPVILWTYQGETLSIDEWSARTGIPYDTLYHRREVRQLPLDQVLTQRILPKPRPQPWKVIETSDGRAGTVEWWSVRTGIRKGLLRQRQHRGWTPDEVVGLVLRATGEGRGATAKN